MKLSPELNPKIFDKDIEKSANRDGFGEGLLEAGEKNGEVMALSADLVESTRVEPFSKKFPDRFIECGVAEQNMASVASGLAAIGKIPFITSYAMFSPGRNWEQIRTTIAYNDQNVKIIGAHSGISVGPDGATHQAIEDIAIMRVMPNMIVLAPADKYEARAMTLFAANHKGPVYIRLGRSKVPEIFKSDIKFDLGKGKWLIEMEEHRKDTVGIVVTGTVCHEALLAAKELDRLGFGVSVLHLPSIKPLDEKTLLQLAEEHDLVVTVEEHQGAGGLGGAVAEYLSTVRPSRILRVGVKDQFGQSGEPEELLKHYEIDNISIVVAVKKIFAIEKI